MSCIVNADRCFAGAFTQLSLMFCLFVHSGLLCAADGAAIYNQGRTTAGTVFFAASENQAPASLFPCSNCHREQGAGSKDAGTSAPNITWNRLTQPSRIESDGATRRQPYDFNSFKRALTEGIDSNGGQLAETMPRYQLNDAETSALINYLARIEGQKQRGVEEDSIHIWLRLPENPELADSLRKTVSAIAGAINARGGIYRRRLLLGQFTDAEAQLSAFCILDLRMSSTQQAADNIISIGIFATDNAPDTAYFLYPHPAGFHKLKHGLSEKKGWTPLMLENRPVDSIIKLLKARNHQQVNTTALIHQADSATLDNIISALNQVKLSPVIVTDAPALSPHSRTLIKHYPALVFILSPPGPESVSGQGQLSFSRLASDYKLSTKHLPAKLWSLTLMRLLTTTLEQSGKQLTQQTFEQTLQRQVDLDTGFGPALSYSANRRIGNSDVVLVQIK